MPKAYMMVHLEVTNPEEFAAGFGSKVADVVKEFGGKFLVQLLLYIVTKTNSTGNKRTSTVSLSFRTENLLLHGRKATSTKPYCLPEPTTLPTPIWPS